MNDLYIKRNIIAIDLKSFFASCECIDRGLDPFTTPLVVCNPKQKGAITLAVTPYLKQFGVPGRCRIYDINKYKFPRGTVIMKAAPRMNLYIENTLRQTFNEDEYIINSYDYEVRVLG